MSTRSPRLLLLLTSALLLVASACGASGGSESLPGVADKTTTTADTTTTEDEVTTTTEDESTTTTEEDDPTSTTSGSDSEGPWTREEYVTAIRDSLGGFFATEDQASCLGEEWVDVLGLENLNDADISPDTFGGGNGSEWQDLDLDDGDANDLFDGYLTCEVDLKQVFTDLSSDGKTPTPTQQACVDGLLTEPKLRESFVNDFFDREMEHDPVDEVDACFE